MMKKVPPETGFKTGSRFRDIEQVMAEHDQQSKDQYEFKWKMYDQPQQYHADADGPDDLERNYIERGQKGPGKSNDNTFNKDEPKAPLDQKAAEFFFCFSQALQVNGGAR